MANYVTKPYLQTQFQNYSEVLKENFAKKDDVKAEKLEYTTTEDASVTNVKEALDTIFAGGVGGDGSGEENTIESISVNGTPITPDTNKNVDITVPTISTEQDNALIQKTDGLYVPTVAEAKVSTETNNIIISKDDGLFAEETITEIQLNNTPLTVTDKKVNIDLSDYENVQSDWDETDTTKASYIANKPNLSNVDVMADDGVTVEETRLAYNGENLAYQKEITDLQDKIDILNGDATVNGSVDKKIADANHLTKEIVDTLPDVADAKENVIYMIKDTSSTVEDVYKEYTLINGAIECIGSTSVDLSNYSNTDEVKELIKDELYTETTIPAHYEIADSTTPNVLEVVADGTATDGQIDLSSVADIGANVGDYVVFVDETTTTDTKYAEKTDTYSKAETDAKILEAVTDGTVSLDGYVKTETLTEELTKKVNVVEGKGLSTNDLTDELKAQYDKAEENVQSDWDETDETSDAFIKNKPEIQVLGVEDIENMIGLSTEELEGLSQIIDDTTVRVDKTNSSSYIYQSIQDAITTGKEFTLSEIAKASTASYKVVSSTEEMVDTKYIYLLENGDTYDLYIYEENLLSATKIGNTSINLSDYYTKTECDNAFVLKTAFELLNSQVSSILDGTTTVPKTTDADTIGGLTADEFAKTIDLDDYLPITGGIMKGAISFQSLDNGYCGITKMHDENIDDGMLIQDNDKDGNIVAVKLCAKSGKFTFHKDRVGYEEILHTGNIGSYLGVNIPRTEVAINTTNFSSGTVTYTIVNGICYVEVSSLAPITTGGHKHVNLGALPTPATNIFINGIYDIQTSSTEPLNSFYMNESYGTLICHIRSASVTFCSFSYPIKVISPDDKMILYANGVNNAEFAYEACNVFPLPVAQPNITLGDSLTLELNSSSDGNCGAIISKAIDLTNYNTLKFTHNSTTTSASDYNRTSCYILNDKVVGSVGWWNNFKVAQYNMLMSQTSTSGEIIIDVSNLSGEHYIEFEVSANASATTTLVLSNICLE